MKNLPTKYCKCGTEYGVPDQVTDDKAIFAGLFSPVKLVCPSCGEQEWMSRNDFHELALARETAKGPLKGGNNVSLVGTRQTLDRLIKGHGEDARVTDVVGAELQKILN